MFVNESLLSRLSIIHTTGNHKCDVSRNRRTTLNWDRFVGYQPQGIAPHGRHRNDQNKRQEGMQEKSRANMELCNSLANFGTHIIFFRLAFIADNFVAFLYDRISMFSLEDSLADCQQFHRRPTVRHRHK